MYMIKLIWGLEPSMVLSIIEAGCWFLESPGWTLVIMRTSVFADDTHIDTVDPAMT